LVDGLDSSGALAALSSAGTRKQVSSTATVSIRVR